MNERIATTKLNSIEELMQVLEDAENKALATPEEITENDVQMILQKINPSNIKTAVKVPDIHPTSILIDPKA